MEDEKVSEIVSFSEIMKYQTCPRQYYYRFILGHAPIEESVAIKTGIKGHRLLQTFHELLKEGKTKEEAHEAVKDQAKKILDESDLSDYSSLVNAWILVDNYIRDTDFTAEAILVENRFLIPATKLSDDPFLSNIQIGFTPDVVFERKSKRLDVEDYKFIQRAWSAGKINRFPQTRLYEIFLESMGYDISRSILRFFNVATGRMNEKTYTLTAEEAKILTRDFMAGVKDVVSFRRSPLLFQEEAPRTMNYNSCQFCQFEYPCSLEASGKSAKSTLNTQFKKSDYDYNR